MNKKLNIGLFGFIITLYIILSTTVLAQQNTQTQQPLPQLNGFVETRLGFRINNDANEKDLSIGELRLQLEMEKDFSQATFNIVADVVVDPVLDNHYTNLQSGDGTIDLRQFNIEFSPLDNMDVKLGRQILTWGTGDLLFINDLFAKDWNAFLIGRDTEYLKVPTNAIKTSLFFDIFNLDIVYTPRFTADRFIDGRRISFYDLQNQTAAGRNNTLTVIPINDTFTDDELAIRLYQSFAAFEWALYYYSGFWKSPAGSDAATRTATFPVLEVWGSSLRGPVANGIGYVEVGYYKSNNNAKNNALSRNSEYRILTGYEQEIATELTASVQYYLEHKLNYTNYVNSLATKIPRDDENRQIITLRLTQLLLQQNLKLSFFNFYSPSDDDAYTRIITTYKISDAIKVEAGLNYLYGKKRHTFYAQLKDNSNIYSAIRYEF